MTKLEVGTQLCTRRGQSLTNAIVAGFEGDKVFVLTDFGNIRIMDEHSVLGQYEISESYLEYKQMDYPFASIEERINHQIALLTAAKKKLNLA